MLGLGSKGKIEIQLDKVNFHSGDTVQGAVALKLSEPIKAKELCITILGREITTSNNRNIRNTQRDLFSFKQTLDKEKEYTVSENPLVYPFKITIPKGVLPEEPKKIEGGLGQALQIGQMIGMIPSQRKRVEWSLTAKLDIRMGFDINKTIQINVTK
jgi:hypothetical protein